MSDTAESTDLFDTTQKRLSFERAREIYLPQVHAFVSRRLDSVEDAEDVCAQVFVAAYRNWWRLRGEPKLWLLGIARRKVADSIRRRKPAKPLHESLRDPLQTQHHKDTEDLLDIRELVMRLPEGERDALLMQVLEELSIAEISTVLGRSVKATNSLLQRARAKIRHFAQETSKEIN